VEEVLSIAEVAKRSAVASSALRFYEEQGLIQSERTSAGRLRLYPRAAIRRIAFIVFAHKSWFVTGGDRAELAKLPAHRVPERSDRAKLSGGWTKRIDERITMPA
jgi:MerR family redox-sensitive transcriptional activator SoxR